MLIINYVEDITLIELKSGCIVEQVNFRESIAKTRSELHEHGALDKDNFNLLINQIKQFKKLLCKRKR